MSMMNVIVGAFNEAWIGVDDLKKMSEDADEGRQWKNSQIGMNF